MAEKNGMGELGVLGDPKPIFSSSFTAKEKALRRDFLDTTNLVRSIQRAEGNPDCFRKAEGYCDRLDCSWRAYCLREGDIPPGRERDQLK